MEPVDDTAMIIEVAIANSVKPASVCTQVHRHT